MNPNRTRTALVVAFSLLILGSLGADELVELKFSSFTPPPHIMNTLIFPPWIQEVESRAGGLIKITLFPGSTLGKPEDHYEMAAKGVVDITWGLMSYTPGRFPLTTVMELPFISASTDIGCRIISRLFQQGYLQKEYADVKVLSLGTSSNIELHTRNKLIRSADDLKGLRIRVTSPGVGQLLKQWGAVPISMPANEVYLSLERGVIDGLFIDAGTLYAMRCNEVTRFHTRIGMLNSPFFVVMNHKSWEKLPPAARQAIEGLSGEYFSADLNGQIVRQAEAGTWRRLEAEGHTVLDLPEAEVRRWEEAAQAIYRGWIDEMKAKGLPADEVLSAALRIRQELTGKP
jgi:TRAP-type C4-dicarboxylate transport system substrate-binding protein